MLCVDKKEIVVKYILTDSDSQLIDPRYMECIPSKNDFRLMIKQFFDGKE